MLLFSILSSDNDTYKRGNETILKTNLFALTETALKDKRFYYTQTTPAFQLRFSFIIFLFSLFVVKSFNNKTDFDRTFRFQLKTWYKSTHNKRIIIVYFIVVGTPRDLYQLYSLWTFFLSLYIHI